MLQARFAEGSTPSLSEVGGPTTASPRFCLCDKMRTTTSPRATSLASVAPSLATDKSASASSLVFRNGVYSRPSFPFAYARHVLPICCRLPISLVGFSLHFFRFPGAISNSFFASHADALSCSKLFVFVFLWTHQLYKPCAVFGLFLNSSLHLRVNT